MVYAQNRIYQRHIIFWNFEMQMDQQIPLRRPDLVWINKKKIICHLIYFIIPVHHWVKIEESLEAEKDIRTEGNGDTS